ncbi:MAG: hypothetical protein CBD27_04435 [Rhodospirillaceae bacterium TMED167]|nr:hypothetical protein [Rhodospirillaceae bacterium]OUW28559.1 MAG: hypothetical protein CBD27_04435 [Rhodospirillaceae bacterium TMED167]
MGPSRRLPTDIQLALLFPGAAALDSLAGRNFHGKQMKRIMGQLMRWGKMQKGDKEHSLSAENFLFHRF